MTVELPEGINHGTHGAYGGYKCRCEACVQFHSEACSAQYQERRRRFAAGEANPPHGTVSTYSGWGCRCDACSEASRLYNRDLRAGVRIGNRTKQVATHATVWASSRPITT